MEKSKEFYSFIGKVALEYRVSLKNLCKLLDIDATEVNQKEIYDSIFSTLDFETKRKNVYQYLFYYETMFESEEASNLAYKNAASFLRDYAFAKRMSDDDTKKEIIDRLTKTDRDFNKIKNKEFDKPLTEEETIIISKYRIKYCIPKSGILNALGIDKDRLRANEKKLTDNVLKEKIEELSNFHLTMSRLKNRGENSVKSR
ncbi:MAG: hypothetical protein Q4E75_00210 [bacterium]|nr:hypothetical protein [bacterium]